MFTTARHWSLSWTTRIQSTHSHPLFLRSILILSSLQGIGLPSDLFLALFPIPYAIFSSFCHFNSLGFKYSPQHSVFDLETWQIWYPCSSNSDWYRLFWGSSWCHHPLPLNLITWRSPRSTPIFLFTFRHHWIFQSFLIFTWACYRIVLQTTWCSKYNPTPLCK